MTSPIDDLKAVIAAGNAVIVAGTGVSVAATQNKKPLVTWKGLLLDGLGHCKPGKLITLLIETLNDSPSLEDYLDAATKVETTLRKDGRYEQLPGRAEGHQARADPGHGCAGRSHPHHQLRHADFQDPGP